MRTKDGRPWSFIKPSYFIPDNIESKLRRGFDKLYNATCEIQTFVKTLPFSTTPVWPPRLGPPSDFCYCVCPKCEKPIQLPEARLCLCFTVVRHPDDTYEMYWRPRLSCCDEIPITPSVPILCVERLMTKPMKAALSGFSSRIQISKKKCYVCEQRLPCSDPICEYVLGHVVLTQSCEEYMWRVLEKLKACPLTALSLCECGNLADAPCRSCGGPVFCSKKCRRNSAHNCESFLKAWEW